jgi:YVTN family beta-propeller protein
MRAIVRAALVLSLLVAAFATACGDPTAGGHLVVANLRSSDVSFIDLATGRETARAAVAENPHELARTPDGLLVSNYRSASVTRLTAGGAVAGVNPLPGEPHGIAVSGNLAAVTQGRAGRVALLDARDGTLRAEIETGGEPHMVTAAAGFFYVVDAADGVLIEIDPAAAAVNRRVPVGATPESVVASPDGRTIAVANARSGDLSLVDRETFAERRVEVPGAPVRVSWSPDGGTVAASLNDTGNVALLDARGGTITALIAVGSRPDGLMFDPAGRRLYVALSGDHRVAVVDVKQRRAISTIDAGDGPSGLLVLP